jgi:hypothetical protein
MNLSCPIPFRLPPWHLFSKEPHRVTPLAVRKLSINLVVQSEHFAKLSTVDVRLVSKLIHKCMQFCRQIISPADIAIVLFGNCRILLMGLCIIFGICC